MQFGDSDQALVSTYSQCSVLYLYTISCLAPDIKAHFAIHTNSQELWKMHVQISSPYALWWWQVSECGKHAQSSPFVRLNMENTIQQHLERFWSPFRPFLRENHVVQSSLLITHEEHNRIIVLFIILDASVRWWARIQSEHDQDSFEFEVSNPVLPENTSAWWDRKIQWVADWFALEQSRSFSK